MMKFSNFLLVCLWRNSPHWARASSFTRFLDHTQRRTTVGRTPLDECSARRIYFYMTTHNTHNRQTSMPPVGFEPTISAGERPQTYAFRRPTPQTAWPLGPAFLLLSSFNYAFRWEVSGNYHPTGSQTLKLARSLCGACKENLQRNNSE